jgi:hypothetical protein
LGMCGNTLILRRFTPDITAFSVTIATYGPQGTSKR